MQNTDMQSSKGKNYDSILPVELVSLVQYLSLPDFEDDWKFAELGTIRRLWATLARLLLVSKRWNVIARSTRQLWVLACLDVPSGNDLMRHPMGYDLLRGKVEMAVEHFHLFLARSNGAPIYLVLRSDSVHGLPIRLTTRQNSNEENVEALINNAMNALWRESPRVHVLSLQGRFSEVWRKSIPFNHVRCIDVDCGLLDVPIAPSRDLRYFRIRNLNGGVWRIAQYLGSIDPSSLVEIQVDGGNYSTPPEML
jgi:hypothetical protein